MTGNGGAGLEGSYAQLAELLDQHSEQEQALLLGVLFGAEVVPRQQCTEARVVTPLPQRRARAASVKVVVRKRG